MVYDVSDAAWVEEWWSHCAQIEAGDDNGTWLEDDDTLPPEDEALYLDQWRTDFLSFLTEEGARRHGELWTRAAALWAERSKARNIKGLRPGESEHRQVAEDFAAAVENAAIEEWGLEAWRSQFPVWEAARETGDDLLQPWEHLLEIVALPNDPEEIAAHLRGQLRNISDKPTLLALARSPSRPGAHQLTAVTDVLMDDGFSGLFLIPQLPAFSGLRRDVSRVTDRAGAAAGAANRLAHVVTTILHKSSHAG